MRSSGNDSPDLKRKSLATKSASTGGGYYAPAAWIYQSKTNAANCRAKFMVNPFLKQNGSCWDFFGNPRFYKQRPHLRSPDSKLQRGTFLPAVGESQSALGGSQHWIRANRCRKKHFRR